MTFPVDSTIYAFVEWEMLPKCLLSNPSGLLSLFSTYLPSRWRKPSSNVVGFYCDDCRGEAGAKYTNPALSFEQQTDRLLNRGFPAARTRLIEILSCGS
jgi:hypothetical protein